MSRSLIRMAALSLPRPFRPRRLDGVGQQVVPGAGRCGRQSAQARSQAPPPCAPPCPAGARARARAPAEIARYFQLYGGYIDPTINKQSQGGPFDSGFFFDSGIGPNGGNSPYMN